MMCRVRGKQAAEADVSKISSCRMKLCILIGTRPEIIKMSPIIREAETRSLDFFVLHTGQHAAFDMDAVFFRDLDLAEPKYKLDAVVLARSRTPAALLALMLPGIEQVLVEERPDVVLVPSDPHTTLAGAIAAAHLQIPIGHVESGLRSYDWSMPEELNRIMTDHISTYLFAPTAQCAAILRGEGIPVERIHVTGNTVIDALRQNLELAHLRSGVLADLGLKPRKYVLVTFHRSENLNSRERTSGVIAGLWQVGRATGLEVVLPLHPSTRRAIETHGVEVPDGVRRIPPQGYLDFLLLQSEAALVLTDSGGIQEEACALHVPCVTLRENTERPESVEVGANQVAGTQPERIVRATREMIERPRTWANPFGDGHAAERILDVVTR
jgi:UDP-N-acetylglucosamine 2-epimerase (non-hydrolysing)